MTQAEIIQLADSVTKALNSAGNWAVEFEAEREYFHDLDLEEIDGIVVKVSPATEAGRYKARGAWEFDTVIDIGVIRKIQHKTLTRDELDEMVLLVKQMQKYFRSTALSNTAFVMISSAIDPVYSQEHLKTRDAFFSVLNLSFRSFEDR